MLSMAHYDTVSEKQTVSASLADGNGGLIRKIMADG